jgi:hypothetical protein
MLFSIRTLLLLPPPFFLLIFIFLVLLAAFRALLLLRLLQILVADALPQVLELPYHVLSFAPEIRQEHLQLSQLAVRLEGRLERGEIHPPVDLPQVVDVQLQLLHALYYVISFLFARVGVLDRVQVTVFDADPRFVVGAEESHVRHSGRVYRHHFGRPVRETFQFRPDEQVGLGTDLDEPGVLLGVGVQITRRTVLHFGHFLLANLNDGLGRRGQLGLIWKSWNLDYMRGLTAFFNYTTKKKIENDR